jgi:hypothetical protein
LHEDDGKLTRFNISFYAALIITASAFALRIATISFIVPVDYRWDSYHYWQIAFYSLKIGFPQRRLWDLDGLEYFWGPLPILSESFLLGLLNTTSISPFRALNVLVGSGSVFVAYVIGYNYYSPRTGLLAAVLLALNPLSIFNSTIGLGETFGAFFLLLGMFLHRDHQFYSGLALGFASLSRTELWLISIGVIATYAIFEGNLEKTVASAGGWLVAMAPDFYKVGADTNNPIYPFYWSFLGNIGGAWSVWAVPFEVRATFSVILAASIVGLVLLVHYRSSVKVYAIPAVFLGLLVYHGLTYALTGAATPLYDRYFVADMAVGALLLAYGASKIRRGFKVIAVALILLELGAVSYMTPYYTDQQSGIERLFSVADQIGARYTGGTVLSDMPMINYRLIHHWGISERNILGTLYMPKSTVQAGVLWLKSHNATWLVVGEEKGRQTLSFIENASTSGRALQLIYALPNGGTQAYEINLSALAS